MNPTRDIAEEIVLSVPRSAEIVWQILAQPNAAELLMGPTISTDQRETRVTLPIGPVSVGLSTSAVAAEVDDDGKTMVIELNGDITGTLTLAAEPSGACATDLRCAFDGTVTGQMAQMSAGITDQVSVTLSEQLAQAITAAPVPDSSVVNLETVLKFALPGLGVVALAWVGGIVLRRRAART